MVDGAGSPILGVFCGILGLMTMSLGRGRIDDIAIVVLGALVWIKVMSSCIIWAISSLVWENILFVPRCKIRPSKLSTLRVPSLILGIMVSNLSPGTDCTYKCDHI